MTTKLQHPRGRPQVEAKCVPAWGTHTMCPALKACQLLSLFRQLSAARVCNRACQGPVWVKHVGGRGGAGVPVCVHDSSLRSPAPPAWEAGRRTKWGRSSANLEDTVMGHSGAERLAPQGTFVNAKPSPRSCLPASFPSIPLVGVIRNWTCRWLIADGDTDQEVASLPWPLSPRLSVAPGRPYAP